VEILDFISSINRILVTIVGGTNAAQNFIEEKPIKRKLIRVSLTVF